MKKTKSEWSQWYEEELGGLPLSWLIGILVFTILVFLMGYVLGVSMPYTCGVP